MGQRIKKKPLNKFTEQELRKILGFATDELDYHLLHHKLCDDVAQSMGISYEITTGGITTEQFKIIIEKVEQALNKK